MKKIFFTFLSVIFCALSFASERILPNGVSANVTNVKETDGKITEAKLNSSGVVFQTSLGEIAAKKYSRIYFYINGTVKSVVPENGSTIIIDDDCEPLPYANNENIEFYDNGNVKSFAIEGRGIDFKLFGINFFGKTKQDILQGTETTSKFAKDMSEYSLKIKVECDENGKLSKIKSAEKPGNLQTALAQTEFIFQFGDNFIKSSEIAFYPGEKIKSIKFSPLLKEEITPEHYFIFNKIVYDESGNELYKVGQEVKKGQTRFYDTSTGCIVLVKDGKNTKLISDENITNSSEVIFDDNGNPVKYTAPRFSKMEKNIEQ